MGMNETPSGERVHIAFFWTEKCGKIESGQCGDRAGAGDRVGHPGNDDRSGL